MMEKSDWESLKVEHVATTYVEDDENEHEMPYRSKLDELRSNLDIIHAVMTSMYYKKDPRFFELAEKIAELADYCKRHFPEHVPKSTSSHEVKSNPQFKDDGEKN